MPVLSSYVKELINSKSTKELYRIYNHLVDVSNKFLVSGKRDYLNQELMLYINDILFDRYVESCWEGC